MCSKDSGILDSFTTCHYDRNCYFGWTRFWLFPSSDVLMFIQLALVNARIKQMYWLCLTLPMKFTPANANVFMPIAQVHAGTSFEWVMSSGFYIHCHTLLVVFCPLAIKYHIDRGIWLNCSPPPNLSSQKIFTPRENNMFLRQAVISEPVNSQCEVKCLNCCAINVLSVFCKLTTTKKQLKGYISLLTCIFM